jgi:hypothetical protein
LSEVIHTIFSGTGEIILNLLKKERRAVAWAVGLFLTLGTLLPASAQMDDVTMPGGTPPGPPTVSRSARLSESEFKEWAAKPGAVVFDLQYRGLNIEEKELAPALWGGSSNTPTPFIQSLGISRKNYLPFRLRALRGSDEGAVEHDGKTVKALYLDFDCDGRLGAGEKMEPVLQPQGKDEAWYFISPDFTINTPDRGKVLYRVLVKAYFAGDSLQTRVTPFCFWEGEAKVGDTLTTLRLSDQNINGSFSDFMADSIFEADMFQLAAGPLSQFKATPVPSERLSSLVQMNKTFYQLRLSGEGSKEKPLRAVLWKDPSPTGKLAARQAHGQEMKFQKATLVSTEMPSARFEINGPDTEIPEGRYRIESANLTFGPRDAGKVSLINGPECRIVGGQTIELELEKPEKINLVAIEESYRSSSLKTGKAFFPRDTDLYLTTRLVGAQGEEYRDFSERSANGKLLAHPKPHLQILGPDGQEVVSADFESWNVQGFSWKTQGLAPGRYTAKVKYNTGGFAGEIETESVLTLLPKSIASTQMDNVTMPGETEEPIPLLRESEFKEWAAKPGAVVFNLQYRGMELEEKDQVRSFWDQESGSPLKETSFTQSLRLPKEKSKLFRLPLLCGSENGVLEYEGKTLKALYLDLDCDGKLGPGEKLKPEEKNRSGYFLTPDFTVITSRGEKSAYRVIAQVDGDDPRLRVSNAPFCCWEGKANLAGTEITLRLTDDNYAGSFLVFGGDRFELFKGTERKPAAEGFLSSLICLDQTFYQLRFTGEGTQKKPWRAVLCRETAPTGKVEVRLDQAGPEAKLTGLQLVSSEMASSRINQDNSSVAELPQGRYKISGNLAFGTKENPGRVSFSKESDLNVVGGQTTRVGVGNPKLKLSAAAVSPQEGLSPEKKTVFPVGTLVYLDLKLVGAQGEEYGYIFSDNPKSPPLKKPHLQILGPDGQEGVSSDLEYG